MTTIHIPPAALEAGAKALAADAGLNWEDISYTHNILRREARAAFLAIVEAWPQRKEEWRDNITFDGKPIRYSVLILPLTEKQDDNG